MPESPQAATPSDEELALCAQRGCADSFDCLVRRFQVPLLQFLRQWSRLADAEDLVQDTFVRAYQNLHRYDSSWRFATWVFTIARRLSLNRQRARRPAAGSESLNAVEAATPPPAQLAAEKDSRRHLWSLAAAVLNRRQMTAMWLYYVEDMSVKEVARVLGGSRVAVKTMLHRARRKLMPALKELDPNGAAQNRTRSLEISPS